jgi:superfamily II DNA or RNA helicase
MVQISSRALQPRPDQVDALTDLTRAFAVHDRAQLIMACGTGKSLIGRWHAQAAQADRALVLVPSLALLAQTLGEWRRAGHSGYSFEALVVCSDPSTSAGAAERVGADVDAPYWATVRARVTTSSAEAAGFLTRKTAGRPQVVFSTYHSAPVVARAQAECGAVFDLAVCDEAHRLAGRPREEFRVALDRRGIVARKRLFMTATPQVQIDGDDVLDMGDRRLFGPVAHTVSFGEAIDAGLLCDYQVLVVAGRDGPAAPDGVGAETVPAALLDAVDRYGIRRVLSFHGRVGGATDFANLLDGVTTAGGYSLRCRTISGTMPAAERARVLAWLGADQREYPQVRLVSNARCLTEGVDVPNVGAVLFAGQRTSVVDIIQAVGRVLRPAPGKRLGTVIVPVSLPPNGDDDTALTLSAFGHVWAVLRGLRAHDQRLAQELDQAVREYARGTRRIRHSTDRVRFVLPADLDESAIQLRLVQEVGSAWERYYAAAWAWSMEHSGKRLMRLASHDGLSVGEWAVKQRQARSQGLLLVERVLRLEEIPGWYWDRGHADWEDTYSILQAVAEAHGTIADNPTGPSILDGLKSSGYGRCRLGVWLARQRQDHRDGMLAPDRAALLEQLPGWDWDAGLPADDVAMVQALRVYGEFEKHVDVHEAHVEDGIELGRWVWAVRRRKVTGRLAPALADELAGATPVPDGSKIGPRFPWQQSETQFRIMYSALRSYARREGQATPPASHKEPTPDAGRVGVGQWCSRQRWLHRQGQLDQKYVTWLEALPGWTWEVGLTKVDYGQPLDLGGHRHGTAKGIAAGCKCRDCLEARRANDRGRLARKREIVGGVPAGKARAHLTRLEAAGAKRGAIVTVSGVTLGAIRKIASGDWPVVTRETEARLLAVTPAMCAAASGKVGSRGRLVSAENEKIDAAPTRAILDDLAERGFGTLWVSRELGYVGGLQVGRDVVTRRIAAAIADLSRRVGDLRYERTRANQKSPPPLRDLLARDVAS